MFDRRELTRLQLFDLPNLPVSRAAMKLKEIHRTSTFAWSPYASLPLLATGTVAGALDASFSNDSQLEIWAPNFINRDEYDLGGTENLPPKATVTTSSRYRLLASIVVVNSLLTRHAGLTV